MSIFQRVVNHYVTTFRDRGERMAKIKALSLSLEALNAGRKLALAIFFAFIGCTLFAASIVALITYIVDFRYREGYLPFDSFVGSFFGLAIAALFVMLYFMSERYWLSAFHVDEKIQELTSRIKPGRSLSADASEVRPETIRLNEANPSSSPAR